LGIKDADHARRSFDRACRRLRPRRQGGFAAEAVELILRGATIASNAVLAHRLPDCHV
jgi:hypothetical protein